ncbi:unnamed protein product [Linum trigynum]|uniref:Uncharacterized protein n=1 Tax=Linum trigynum TaxID=586398 RepID=A0AAV2GIW8_9ROSI
MPVYTPPSLISSSRSTPCRCSARCSPSTGSGIATASPSPFSAFRRWVRAANLSGAAGDEEKRALFLGGENNTTEDKAENWTI